VDQKYYKSLRAVLPGYWLPATQAIQAPGHINPAKKQPNHITPLPTILPGPLLPNGPNLNISGLVVVALCNLTPLFPTYLFFHPWLQQGHFSLSSPNQVHSVVPLAYPAFLLTFT
jgi:hypothetical protein